MLETVGMNALPMDATAACVILEALVKVASDPGLWARTQAHNEQLEGGVGAVHASRAHHILSHYALRIRDAVVRVHPTHAAVQTLAMQFVQRLARTRDQLLFTDDVLAILLNPLVHSRGSIKAALAVFKKANVFVTDMFKPHPKVFVELALLFDKRGDEGMVLHVLTAAAFSRVKRPFVEAHKDFLLSLFHKSVALRRAVFMYLASSPRFNKKTKALGSNGILNDMTALVTAEDIAFMREHGGGAARRVCSSLVD